ncbi:hypothetical protein Leryth_004783, partial [Lithospermum erythrorhizon]
ISKITTNLESYGKISSIPLDYSCRLQQPFTGSGHLHRSFLLTFTVQNVKSTNLDPWVRPSPTDR